MATRYGWSFWTVQCVAAHGKLNKNHSQATKCPRVKAAACSALQEHTWDFFIGSVSVSFKIPSIIQCKCE